MNSFIKWNLDFKLNKFNYYLNLYSNILIITLILITKWDTSYLNTHNIKYTSNLEIKIEPILSTVSLKINRSI